MTGRVRSSFTVLFRNLGATRRYRPALRNSNAMVESRAGVAGASALLDEINDVLSIVL